MGINFGNLNLSGERPRPIEPIGIFQSSSVADSNINDLWLAQGDALRDWHEHRKHEDVAVVLNTGAGKTLVGLLMAQSLVNETRGHVVYACSSIQLVEQTATKAKGYGLPVTTYLRGEFSDDDLYHKGEAPCVTTYQALFNGKTRFRADDVSAAVFDDAHTAEHILRDQFSLTIRRVDLPDIYDQIFTLFHPYHDSVGLASSYAEVSDRKSDRLFFVPPFEVQNNVAELRRLLLGANLSEKTSTMFAWEHIRDHEDLCCLMISRSEIVLTPPVVPVSTLPYFGDGVRRVYLSATLSAPDSFVRAFGRQPDKIVAPYTTAGECERMVLIPSLIQGIDDDASAAKSIVRDHKALIMVPSFREAEKWADISHLPDRQHVSQEVDLFREAPAPKKITLAARYDGIDLPGDTCRVMVLDEIPRGAGPLERFQWDRLHMKNSLLSLLSSRIVQSFGRISRGMSDHGVVVITGQSLVDWLLVPRNRSLLPGFLQKQIEIGEAVSKSATDVDGLIAASNSCINRDPAWIQAYTNNMEITLPKDVAIDIEKALKIALAEARFGKALWDRDFQSAANELDQVLDDAYDFSKYSGAWLSLWVGYALQMSGDDESAADLYRRAHVTERNLPRPAVSQQHPDRSLPQQVVNVAEQMSIRASAPSSISLPRTFDRDLGPLSRTATPRQVEEALRCLGQYLGFDSTRPDNETGTGPDVLWIDEAGSALCMEVKTDKQVTSRYTKRDLGQLHNHVQWVIDNHPENSIIPVLVGPLVSATHNASPSSTMMVAELREFGELGSRLKATLHDAASQAFPLNLSSCLYELMAQRQLLYSDVLRTIEMKPLLNVAKT